MADYKAMPLDIKQTIMSHCDAKTCLGLKLTCTELYNEITVTKGQLCCQIIDYLIMYIDMMIAPVVYKKTVSMCIHTGENSIFWLRWKNGCLEFVHEVNEQKHTLISIYDTEPFDYSVDHISKIQSCLDLIEATITDDTKVDVAIRARNMPPYFKTGLAKISTPSIMTIKV